VYSFGEPMSDSSREAAQTTGHPLFVDQLGKYFLIAELARGGMGIVYLAAARGPAGFSKLFVVKELKSEDVPTQKQVRAFLEEARLAARLSHPNIVHTNEVASDGDRHFMVMEYLDGQPLSRLNKRMRLAEETPSLELSHIVVEALAGLHSAHELQNHDGQSLNVVHRDISPQNIFVTYDGQVKVMDFGIAKTTESSNHTATGLLKGKLAFMAPEQVRSLPLDRRAELLAGKRLWAMKNDIEIVAACIANSVPDPTVIEPSFPEPLAAVVRKATRANRDERYSTALEMQEDLERTLSMMNVPGFNPRETGRKLAANFQNDRARIKSVIDAQVKRLSSTRNPTLAIPMLQLSQRPPSDLTPSHTGQSAQSSEISAPLRTLSHHPKAQGSPVDASEHEASHPMRTRLIALAILGVSLLTIGAFTFVSRSSDTQAERLSKRFRLETSPPGARVTLQGTLLGQTPLEDNLSPGEHVLELRRDGFEPETLRLNLEADRVEIKFVNIALRPHSPAEPTNLPAPVQPSAATAQPVVVAAPQAQAPAVGTPAHVWHKPQIQVPAPVAPTASTPAPTPTPAPEASAPPRIAPLPTSQKTRVLD
jgi:eukaryotic-like serine/threonine-protein kinase